MKKEFELLKTDYYQLAMVVAYILLDQANDMAGFEAYYRRTNTNINPDDDFYYLGGGNELHKFAQGAISLELKDPDFLEAFIDMIKPKLPAGRADIYVKLIRIRWPSLIKDFTFSIYPKGVQLFPYVPAFQYYGPKWLGQLIETRVVNTINGATGWVTKNVLNNFDSEEEKEYLNDIVTGKATIDHGAKYSMALRERAAEYRASTSKILLEAAFRRAPGFEAAHLASTIALRAGWDGTSNTSLANDEEFYDKINGTQAHSFVMSHPTQIEACANWNMIYPNSTILTCTYDVMECLEELILYNIKPAMIRIDVQPLDELARKVRARLDVAGWTDVKIFLSGDITPNMLRAFEESGVPFDACMAGTAYANIAGVEKVNAGFVYKLVQFEKKTGLNPRIYYPEKKANGKNSYASLKRVEYDEETKTLKVISNKFVHQGKIAEKMGFHGFKGKDVIEHIEMVDDSCRKEEYFDGDSR